METADKQAEELEARFLVVNSHFNAREFAKAESLLQGILADNPGNLRALHALGLVATETGELESAVKQLSEALELHPDHVPSMIKLGAAKMKMGNCEEALVQFERALLLDPFSPQAFWGAAEMHNRLNRSVVAEAICRQGLVSNPENPSLLMMLGKVLYSQGCIAEEEECLRRVIAHDPKQSIAISMLIYTLNYDPLASQEDIYSLSVAWERSCCAAISRIKDFPNTPEPVRPLRIGYVSGDFCSHPVGFHILPVLRKHDRKNFHVFCYYNSFTGDEMTREIIGLADGWRVIAHLNDLEAADIIRTDGIDILVDLAGHNAKNRLPLFAGKAAPVQATWLGYFNTTGLSAIDYLISDDATILPNEDHLFSEKVIRLPWSRFCFTPFAHLPDVVHPPSITNGYITFGSFNNLAKINPMVVSLWSRVLRELPGSRLIFKRGGLCDSRIRQRFSDLFAENGVSPDRIDFRDSSSYGKMLSEYGEVDIALDPFPFSGGLTTLDALLMGVPVVTLPGKLPISRQTRSFYRVLNLLELVARDEDRYCAIIADLARDRRRLQELRNGLRKRVMNSYLCNGMEFTRNLENAYRAMWQVWCSSQANAGTNAGNMAGE